MKNYTLKQKLKAENIIKLEINSFSYPENYKEVIETLNNYKYIGELKLSQAIQILEYCNNENNLNEIYNIFANTEEEVKQIQTDLKNYINQNTL